MRLYLKLLTPFLGLFLTQKPGSDASLLFDRGRVERNPPFFCTYESSHTEETRSGFQPLDTAALYRPRWTGRVYQLRETSALERDARGPLHYPGEVRDTLEREERDAPMPKVQPVPSRGAMGVRPRSQP